MTSEKLLARIALLGGALSIVAFSSWFTVQETEQALITQFGQIKRIINTPGLHWKIPFIEGLAYYDKRVLDYDLAAFEVTAGDQKRLVVDSFTRYQIIDPLRFYKTVNSEAGLQRRLGALIPGLLRGVLGTVPLTKLLSSERSKIMELIRDLVNEAVKELGVKVIEFRIRSANLPQKNNEAIFARMISDRQKEAKEFRAKGAEAAQLIRARADKECLILIAEAKKRSQILRGEGDAKAAAIYATAHSKDPSFYSFFQAMKTYRLTFGNKSNETTIILTPDHKFLKFLGDTNR